MRRSKSERHCERNEDGQILLLALVFVVFISVVVGAGLELAYNALQSSNNLRPARGTDYDADGAMESAIATIRVNQAYGYYGSCFGPDANPGQGSFSPSLSFNNSTPLVVDCSEYLPQTVGAFQRHVMLSVCSSATIPCPANNLVLRADVKFYDDQSYGRAVAIQTWSTR